MPDAFGTAMVRSAPSAPYTVHAQPLAAIAAYGSALTGPVVPSSRNPRIAPIGERKSTWPAIGGDTCRKAVAAGPTSEPSSRRWSIRESAGAPSGAPHARSSRGCARAARRSEATSMPAR